MFSVLSWQPVARAERSQHFSAVQFAQSDWIRDCALCSESEDEEHDWREDWKALLPADAPLTDVADSQRLPVQDVPAPLPFAMGGLVRQHSLMIGGPQCTVPSMHADDCAGNLTPRRSAMISGASRHRATGRPCSRHALSPPSSTHTLLTPIRFKPTAARALTMSLPDEE